MDNFFDIQIEKEKSLRRIFTKHRLIHLLPLIFLLTTGNEKLLRVIKWTALSLKPINPILLWLNCSHNPTRKRNHQSLLSPVLPQPGTRYMQDAQSENPFLQAYNQQSAGKVFQKVAPSETHKEKNHVPADQIEEKKCDTKKNNYEVKRRKELSRLYTEIENNIRDIIPLKHKPSRTDLLSACIWIAKKSTNPNLPWSSKKK